MGMPMGMIKAPGIFNEGFWKHVDAGTQQSNYSVTPVWGDFMFSVRFRRRRRRKDFCFSRQNRLN